MFWICAKHSGRPKKKSTRISRRPSECGQKVWNASRIWKNYWNSFSGVIIINSVSYVTDGVYWQTWWQRCMHISVQNNIYIALIAVIQFLLNFFSKGYLFISLHNAIQHIKGINKDHYLRSPLSKAQQKHMIWYRIYFRMPFKHGVHCCISSGIL